MSKFKYDEKSVYYSINGIGKPLLFLHGDTASSQMFTLITPLYHDFQIIMIDFLGNGQSDRVPAFPTNVWLDEAMQTIGLLEHLHIGKVTLIGTSGGAYAAINAALMRPDLVECVIADSMDGRSLHASFVEELKAERAFSKKDEHARMFYEWCQGEDWEAVVDKNTDALLRCAEQQVPLFDKPLSSLQVPVLLTGSKKDTMVRPDFLDEYEIIKEMIPNCQMHIFEEGDHPAILSNAEEMANIIKQFLHDM